MNTDQASRDAGLRGRARETARKNLRAAFDALARADGRAPCPVGAEVLSRPFVEITPLHCRDFFVGFCERGSGDLAALFPLVRWREEQLLAGIQGPPPADPDGPRRLVVALACYLAGVFTPVVSAGGAYHLAVNAARELTRRVRQQTYRDVLGGGKAGDNPDRSLKYLILAPVFYSLSVFRP
jgi:hypothetical protein